MILQVFLGKREILDRGDRSTRFEFDDLVDALCVPPAGKLAVDERLPAWDEGSYAETVDIDQLYEHFGITADAAAGAVLARREPT